MSLKAFHLVFIAASTVLSAVFTLWCIRELSRTPSAAAAAGAACGALAVVALAIYSVRFLKRAKIVGFL
jgi:hypothetical protein